MTFALNDDQHRLVKKQLQRLEWSGTNGEHCPECGGTRPKDMKNSLGSTIKVGLDDPRPDEGHGRSCTLAACIILTSSKERKVVFCDGDPKGFEEGK